MGESVNATELVEFWEEILKDVHEPTVPELILTEFWFSIGAAQLVDRMSVRRSYSKTLLTVRQRVGLALYDHAREANWWRPVHFTSLLKIARAYLRDSVGHEEALREDIRKEFTGRLGVATVLISRFEPVGAAELQEARLSITKSISQGNTDPTAYEYLLEAYCAEYDHEPSQSLLDEAIRFAAVSERSVGTATFMLAHADLLLRRATAPWHGAVDLDALSAAQALIAGARPTDAEHRVRRVLAKGVADYLGLAGPDVIGRPHARLPFGLRTPGRAVATLLEESAEHVIDGLRNLAMSREPLAVSILADYLFLVGERLGLTEAEVLTEVVDLRGDGSLLADKRSRLLCRRDQLELARMVDDNELRREAITSLAAFVDEHPDEPAPLLILARDIESRGPFPLPIELGTPVPTAEVLRDVAYGRFSRLYERAGELALNSTDLSILDLGGRSGVTSVADYYGLSSETFVFKEQSAALGEYEKDRAAAVAVYLEENELTDRFGVSRTVASYGSNSSDGNTIVARHFVQGTPLAQLVQAVDREERVDLLVGVAEFLARINACEGIATSDGARRAMWQKDVGRWFKVIDQFAAKDFFDRWWALVEPAGFFRKRDAHLDNWLQTPQGRLVAIDFEAKTVRPAGYELAQITDDHVCFEPDDWEARRLVFDAYTAAAGFEAGSTGTVWTSYQAGVLARIIWGLTAPGLLVPGMPEPESRLVGFAESAPNLRARRLADDILNAWTRKRGLSAPVISTKHTTGPGRVRLSKSIAYRLRHDSTLARDDGGWSELIDVQDALKGRVSLDEIAAVATHRGEERFEFQAGRIRAKYGHSVPVDLRYVPQNAQHGYLFHASPWSEAGAILNRKAGIQPMGRVFVHLTDEVREAVRAGVRKGRPLVYGVLLNSGDGVLRAAGHTFLSGPIPVRRLRVVPVSCFWSEIPPLPARLLISASLDEVGGMPDRMA